MPSQKAVMLSLFRNHQARNGNQKWLNCFYFFAKIEIKDIAYLLSKLYFCVDWKHRGRGNANAPQSRISILRGRLNGVGNFIKPMPATPFIGPQAEAPAFEKPEKSWRSYNRCKRHWPGAARHISWSPVRILRWTLHSRPWSHIDNLEIETP